MVETSTTNKSSSNRRRNDDDVDVDLKRKTKKAKTTSTANNNNNNSITRAPKDNKKNGKKNKDHAMTAMPVIFTPGPYDVICAKGNAAKNHPGNVKLRDMIDDRSTQYAAVASRSQKSAVVDEIIGTIRTAGGAFVKLKKKSTPEDPEHGRWYDVGNHLAREKVGQSLREKNHNLYKSSTKSKRKLQRELNQKAVDQMETVVNTNDSVAASVNQLLSNTIGVTNKHKHKKTNNNNNNNTKTKQSSPQKNEQNEDQQQTTQKEKSSSPNTAAGGDHDDDASVDSELEDAMTKANSQILASLKTDETVQKGHHKDGDDGDKIKNYDSEKQSTKQSNDNNNGGAPSSSSSSPVATDNDDDDHDDDESSLEEYDDDDDDEVSDGEMEIALTQANSNLLATLKSDPSVRSILQEKICESIN